MPVFFASRHLLLKLSNYAQSAGTNHRQSAPPLRLVNARQLTGPRRLLRLLVSSREHKSPALDSKFQTNQKTNSEPTTEHLAERPAFCSKLLPSTTNLHPGFIRRALVDGRPFRVGPILPYPPGTSNKVFVLCGKYAG